VVGPHLDLEQAILEQLVHTRRDDVLELVGVALVDHGTGVEAGRLREATLVWVEGVFHVGLGGGLDSTGGKQGQRGGDDGLLHCRCLLDQNL
jgi:hypothetical protein